MDWNLQKKYSPIYQNNENLFIVLDESYCAGTKEEACLTGIASSIYIYNYGLDFTGQVTNIQEEECIPCLLFDENQISIEVGMLRISKDFERLRRKDVNNLFLQSKREIYHTMQENNDKDFSISTAMEKDTLFPFVLINVDGVDYQFNPEVARQIAVDLIHAAESAEQDSFNYTVVSQLDLTQNDKVKYIEDLRIARENYRNSFNEEKQSQQIQSELEKVLDATEGQESIEEYNYTQERKSGLKKSDGIESGNLSDEGNDRKDEAREVTLQTEKSRISPES